MKPQPHPLLWQETKDPHGNSHYEAISMTYGDGNGNPSFLWRIRTVLRNNSVAWSVTETDVELKPHEGFPESVQGLDLVKAWCQEHEDELRLILGDGLLPHAEPEPETPPLVADESGFAPTTKVLAKWSRNEGSLKMFRVWRTADGLLSQDREITEQPELDTALAGYFTQQMIQELVTRLATGGFGRLELLTPFASVEMQCELDFLHVSASSATVRQGGKSREIAIPIPSNDRIMEVIARQMGEHRRQLIEKSAGTTEAQLIASITRQARALGIPCDLQIPIAGEASKILPVELEDIQRGGGDILDPGQQGRRS